MKEAGLFSVGALEEKLSFALPPLLFPYGLRFIFCQNYGYPREFTLKLVHEIECRLRQANPSCAVFDLRIRGWEETSHRENLRDLSRSLQDLCKDLRISCSIVLSNGDLYLGHALGVWAERSEAQDVLRGEGPPDLMKLVLEIGADILMMMKKDCQRFHAKKMLRDKIICGELSSRPQILAEKTIITSSEEGYVQALDLERLLGLQTSLRSFPRGSGLFLLKKPGDWIEKGEPVINLHGPRRCWPPDVRVFYRKIFALGESPPPHHPLIWEKIESLSPGKSI